MNEIKRFIKEEDGMGTLEIVIIIAVLLSMVLIFRGEIQKIWTNAFKNLKDQTDKVKDITIK